MEIDNFDIIRKHLEFKENTDRYIIHIMRRPKDCKKMQSKMGSNECQRLLRTYYIDSLEYFDKKKDAIKELCTTNRARAYILPQVRNNFECLLNLGEKCLESIRLRNWSVKPEHLLRSAYCEYHNSRKKMWILDLDFDEMHGWTVDKVVELVKRYLRKCGKDENECYIVKTKNGCHIVTPPFDLLAASKECDMLFAGDRNKMMPIIPIGLNTCTMNYEHVTGWLHKDGMTLLYLNMED